MTPEQLEQTISKRGSDVLMWQEAADAANASGNYLWQQQCIRKAREAAADVARLVGMRTPETVLAMERERGLA